MTSVFMKRLTLLTLCGVWGCLLLSVVSDLRAEDYAFNEKKVPENKEDLLMIQQALVDHLDRARNATVCIKLPQGFGSGVIVSEDGLVLTAAHVAGGVKKELTVVMNDGSEYKAITKGIISNTDAAMLKIVDKGGREKFPFVEINRDNDYLLGHWVFALGHSGGFDKARGPVLRLGRIVKVRESTLQTDCKVIGGDSGGPLFDMNGLLIGIHSRVSATMEENMHVPMREYIKHWKDLETDQFIGDGPFAKRPVKGSGFLGVATEDSEKGVLIKKVGKGFAAEKAGFKVGDIILEVNGKKVSKKADFTKIMDEMVESQEIEVTVLRGEKTEKIKVTLGKR